MADVLVAGAVEAITADAVLLIILVGDGVHIRLRGHGGVERSVENSHVRLVLAKDLVGGFDAQNGGGVVQRSQRAQVADSLDNLGGDEAALLELLAAVHNAVADGVNLRDIVNDLALIDSGDGGTIAQMAGDQLQALNRLLQKLSGAVADILVAGAVEAVAAHAVLLVIGSGIRAIRIGLARYSCKNSYRYAYAPSFSTKNAESAWCSRIY